jgi:hypothetical protein
MKRTLIVVAMLLAAPLGFADTIHFADGSFLDGVVSRPDANTVKIDIGTRTLSFAATLVSSVETNDKTGDESQITDALAKQQEQALEARTEMTSEQRDRVREALTPLWSTDEAVRNEGRRQLVILNAELPVFQYIDTSLPFTKGTIAPELLSALVQLDVARAKDVLSRYTINLDPGIRGKVLELLGSYKDSEETATIANGMADPDVSVRIRAANALGTAGQKGATPVLIAGLGSTDQQLQNASLAALQQIWASVTAAADLTTPEQWTPFWDGKKDDVTNIVNPADLTPLVTQEQLDKATASHDE